MERLDVAQKSSRLWEVDTLRGIAVVLMIFYHFIWDLNYFGVYEADLIRGPWQMLPRFIASTFLFVMGISMTLSYRRERQRTGRVNQFPKYLRRGAELLGLGLLITLATYLFIGRGFVIFGILHLLGLSTILAYPFLQLNRWISLVTGLVCLGLGAYLRTLIAPFPWFIWLGINQAGRYMVDYYPLLPWFGVALLGIFAGYTWYGSGGRRFALPDLSAMAPIRGLRFLGRHALLIYLVHQPILLGILIALGFGSFA